MQCRQPLLRFIFTTASMAALILPCGYASTPVRPLPPPPPPDMVNTLIGIPVYKAEKFIQTYRANQIALQQAGTVTLSPDTIIRSEGATINIPATLAAMGAPLSTPQVVSDPSFFDKIWAAWTQTQDSPEPAVDPKPCAFPDTKDDRDRFDQVITTLTKLREGGITVAERQFERACLNSMPLPADMVAFNDGRLTALVNNKTFQSGFVALRAKCPADPVTYADHKACQQMLQYFSDGLRGVYNLKSVPVYLVPMPTEANLYGLYTSQIDDKPSILINSNPTVGLLRDRQQLLLTLGEEVQHSIDDSLYTLTTNYKRGFDDPRFMHTAYLRLNWVGAYTSPDVNYDGYVNQYVERTAKQQAADVGRRFSLK